MNYVKFAFVCPKCKTVYSDETETPLNGVQCPDCNLQMHYMGVTSHTWNQFSDDEKAALKEKVIDDYRSPQTMYLKRMSNDVRTIKNILIFFLVISIFAGVIWAIRAFIG